MESQPGPDRCQMDHCLEAGVDGAFASTNGYSCLLPCINGWNNRLEKSNGSSRRFINTRFPESNNMIFPLVLKMVQAPGRVK